jgi:hypothetical protein
MDITPNYIQGYLNRVQSSRRLEREAGRNIEVSEVDPRAVIGNSELMQRKLTISSHFADLKFLF